MSLQQLEECHRQVVVDEHLVDLSDSDRSESESERKKTEKEWSDRKLETGSEINMKQLMDFLSKMSEELKENDRKMSEELKENDRKMSERLNENDRKMSERLNKNDRKMSERLNENDRKMSEKIECMKADVGKLNEQMNGLNERFVSWEISLDEKVENMKEVVKAEVKCEIIQVVGNAIEECKEKMENDLREIEDKVVIEIGVLDEKLKDVKERVNDKFIKVDTEIINFDTKFSTQGIELEQKVEDKLVDFKKDVFVEVNKKLKLRREHLCGNSEKSFREECKNGKLVFYDFRRGDPIRFINSLSEIQAEWDNEWDRMQVYLTEILLDEAGLWYAVGRRQFSHYNDFEKAFRKQFCESKYHEFLMNMLSGSYLQYLHLEPTHYLTEFSGRLIEVELFTESSICQRMIKHFGRHVYEVCVNRKVEKLSEFLEILMLFRKEDIIKDLRVNSMVSFLSNPYFYNITQDTQRQTQNTRDNPSQERQGASTGNNNRFYNYNGNRQTTNRNYNNVQPYNKNNRKYPDNNTTGRNLTQNIGNNNQYQVQNGMNNDTKQVRYFTNSNYAQGLDERQPCTSYNIQENSGNGTTEEVGKHYINNSTKDTQIV